MQYKKEATSHILTASANLIGICLIVITGLRATGLANTTILDDISAVASIFFLISIFSAYLSLRDNIHLNELLLVRYRDIADYSFIVGISLLVIVIVLIAFNFVR